jgi:hypothetical protein
MLVTIGAEDGSNKQQVLVGTSVSTFAEKFYVYTIIIIIIIIIVRTIRNTQIHCVGRMQRASLDAVPAGDQTQVVQPVALVPEMTELSRLPFISIRVFFDVLEFS